MTADRKSNAAILIAFVVMSVAVAGYFTGLQAPMKVTAADSNSARVKQLTDSSPTTAEGVILATHYSEMTATQQNGSFSDSAIDFEVHDRAARGNSNFPRGETCRVAATCPKPSLQWCSADCPPFNRSSIGHCVRRLSSDRSGHSVLAHTSHVTHVSGELHSVPCRKSSATLTLRSLSGKSVCWSACSHGWSASFPRRSSTDSSHHVDAIGLHELPWL